MPHSLVQMLRSVPDFSALDERSLLSIVGESMNLVWKTGSQIFQPGMPGDALYIILSGEVVIRTAEGDELVRLHPGDSFGEVSLLLNTTHRRRANAVTDCELLVLPKEAFLAILDTNELLADHFNDVLRTRYPEVMADLSRG
jgi:CRP-like cAMP-binding protein